MYPADNVLVYRPQRRQVYIQQEFCFLGQLLLWLFHHRLGGGLGFGCQRNRRRRDFFLSRLGSGCRRGQRDFNRVFICLLGEIALSQLQYHRSCAADKYYGKQYGNYCAKMFFHSAASFPGFTLKAYHPPVIYSVIFPAGAFIFAVFFFPRLSVYCSGNNRSKENT